MDLYVHQLESGRFINMIAFKIPIIYFISNFSFLFIIFIIIYSTTVLTYSLFYIYFSKLDGSGFLFCFCSIKKLISFTKILHRLVRWETKFHMNKVHSNLAIEKKFEFNLKCY